MVYVRGWTACSCTLCTYCRYVRPPGLRPLRSRLFRRWEVVTNTLPAHTSDLRAYRSAPPITSVQFHWNDYSDFGYITALQHLQDLQREGLISALGLCNFDAIRMDEICTTLGPHSIVSNQVQVRLDRIYLFLPLSVS